MKLTREYKETKKRRRKRKMKWAGWRRKGITGTKGRMRTRKMTGQENPISRWLKKNRYRDAAEDRCLCGVYTTTRIRRCLANGARLQTLPLVFLFLTSPASPVFSFFVHLFPLRLFLFHCFPLTVILLFFCLIPFWVPFFHIFPHSVSLGSACRVSLTKTVKKSVTEGAGECAERRRVSQDKIKKDQERWVERPRQRREQWIIKMQRKGGLTGQNYPLCASKGIRITVKRWMLEDPQMFLTSLPPLSLHVLFLP